MPRSNKKPRAEIPQGLRFNVFRRDNFTCRYCGKQSPEIILHLDHIKPVADGGIDAEENFATSCVDCNQGKSSKPGIAPPAQRNKSVGFIGMFGHTFDEKGSVHWQFAIDRQLDDEHFAVTTFSWFSGYAHSTEILTKADLLDGKKCRLYRTADEMNDYYERHDWQEIRKRAAT